MMSVYCPRHGHEVLLGHRQILGIEGHSHDLAVRWVCWCGHEGTHLPHARAQAHAHARRTPQAA